MKMPFKPASRERSLDLVASVAPFAIMITPTLTGDGYTIDVQGDADCIAEAQTIAHFIGTQLIGNSKRPSKRNRKTKTAKRSKVRVA
jgi:hypothetical protein